MIYNLVLLNYAGSTEVVHKIVFALLKKFSTMLFYKCDLSIAPSVALHSYIFSLFSFQGAASAEAVVENSGIEPLTS